MGMRTLFVVITLEKWTTIAYTVSEHYHVGIVFFLTYTYIALTAWTMMSLITGIICESLLETQTTDEATAMQQIEQAKTDFAKGLTSVLNSMDADGDGLLTKAEVERALQQNKKLIFSFAALEIDMDEDELLFFFDRLNPTSDQNFGLKVEVVADALKSFTGIAKGPAVWDLKHHMHQIRGEFAEDAESLSQSIEKLHDGLVENGRSFENQLDELLSRVAPKAKKVSGTFRTSL